mmetsp:Transcript_49/g.58  ORF Transcript_49/g.58 Transcript_49/m.58 type:complete len:227 (-) Transcript_49:983-1663(-)
MTNCKQQIKEKNMKIKDIQQRILLKEEALYTKQEEYTQLTVLASNKIKDPTRKLKSTKAQLRKLKNEKLALEECEHECTRQLTKLTKSVKDLKRRNQTETKQVKNLESRVGKIADQRNTDMENHSAVDNSVVKLKTYLKREKESKDKFLLEVNTKKMTAGNYRSTNSDTKTIRPVDWNKIDQSPSNVSKNSWINVKSEVSVNEISKNQKSTNETDTNVSFISFDAD